MDNLYGTYSNEQFENFKEKLHKKLFWLLLYKDPQTKDRYKNIDFDRYFTVIMKEINGLNDLLLYPVEIVEIMDVLQTAYNETKKENFDYREYRKFVLDAHALVDKINKVGD